MAGGVGLPLRYWRRASRASREAAASTSSVPESLVRDLLTLAWRGGGRQECMTFWRASASARGRELSVGTAVRTVDGFPVVFQYGQPIPSFDVRAEVPGEREYLDLDGRWRFAFDPDEAWRRVRAGCWRVSTTAAGRSLRFRCRGTCTTRPGSAATTAAATARAPRFVTATPGTAPGSARRVPGRAGSSRSVSWG